MRPASSPSPWLANVPGGAATAAGLALALRTDGRHRRGWRAVAATTAAAAVLALCATFVVSAIALTETPARYGFDADLIALNAYGDQSASALEEAFGERDDVVAATGFTAGSFLLEGRAVPGLAATSVKGELTPTLLRGRPPRSDDEIVVGRDTLESIAADLGDRVQVQVLTASGAEREPTGDPASLRVVGVATFPPVNQIGTDMPRLGIGALVTRDAFLRMSGDAVNDPEFTAVRLVDGSDPAAVVAGNPKGSRTRPGARRLWFTDTKPAELLQLDAAMPYLSGALVVGFTILLAVLVHALWTRVRANRHDLAVLRVVGCTRGQLDTVTAWQVTPFALGAVLLGIPLGVALGRFAFTAVRAVTGRGRRRVHFGGDVGRARGRRAAGRRRRRPRRGRGGPPESHRSDPARGLTLHTHREEERSMSPTTVNVDVTGAVPIDGSHHISTWVFTPERPAGRVPFLFCLPGGTYTKAYWHLEVPGRPGYSFGEHLAGRGMLVVAIDHLGTGDSSRHPRAAELTPEVVAAANAAALAEVVRRARDGSLVAGVAPLSIGPLVGVGHSMGGMLAIYQQSLHRSFDAIAPLGYGTIGPIIDFSPEIGGDGISLPSRESVMGPAAEGAFDDMPLADRTAPELRRHFYWDDVPPEVIAADDLTNTDVPGVCGLLSVVPFIVSDHAGV